MRRKNRLLGELQSAGYGIGVIAFLFPLSNRVGALPFTKQGARGTAEHRGEAAPPLLQTHPAVPPGRIPLAIYADGVHLGK